MLKEPVYSIMFNLPNAFDIVFDGRLFRSLCEF